MARCPAAIARSRSLSPIRAKVARRPLSRHHAHGTPKIVVSLQDTPVIDRYFRRTSKPIRVPVPHEPERSNAHVAPSEIVLDAAIRYLSAQQSTDDALNTRAFGIFSVSSTVLPVTFGLIRLGTGDVPAPAQAFLIAALVMYIVVLVCAWQASRIRSLSFRPEMQSLVANSFKVNGDELRQWVAAECVASTSENEDVLGRKGIWIGRAVTFFCAEGVCLSTAAVWSLL